MGDIRNYDVLFSTYIKFVDIYWVITRLNFWILFKSASPVFSIVVNSVLRLSGGLVNTIPATLSIMQLRRPAAMKRQSSLNYKFSWAKVTNYLSINSTETPKFCAIEAKERLRYDWSICAYARIRISLITKATCSTRSQSEERVCSISAKRCETMYTWTKRYPRLGKRHCSYTSRMTQSNFSIGEVRWLPRLLLVIWLPIKNVKMESNNLNKNLFIKRWAISH